MISILLLFFYQHLTFFYLFFFSSSSSSSSSMPIRLTYISLTALWLDISDYPLLLSCCDLGICLHTSSSGLDLPMKILDMYGAGLPVLAYYYPTIFELVKNGENGILFRSSSDLSAHLYRLYCDSPYDIRTNEEFNKMKKIVYQIGKF